LHLLTNGIAPNTLENLCISFSFFSLLFRPTVRLSHPIGSRWQSTSDNDWFNCKREKCSRSLVVCSFVFSPGMSNGCVNQPFVVEITHKRKKKEKCDRVMLFIVDELFEQICCSLGCCYRSTIDSPMTMPTMKIVFIERLPWAFSFSFFLFLFCHSFVSISLFICLVRCSRQTSVSFSSDHLLFRLAADRNWQMNVAEHCQQRKWTELNDKTTTSRLETIDCLHCRHSLVNVWTDDTFVRQAWLLPRIIIHVVVINSFSFQFSSLFDWYFQVGDELVWTRSKFVDSAELSLA
jgi:hypothetical protein